LSQSNVSFSPTGTISRLADLAMQALIAGDANTLEDLELDCAQARVPVPASEVFAARGKLDIFRSFLGLAASNLRMLRRIPAGECDYRPETTGYLGTQARNPIADLATVKGDAWGH
jgi:hypothetical protein